MDPQARIAKYEAELRRLDVLYRELDELWDRVPRYALLALLAPVVWYFKGWGWALVEVLVTAALVGTQAYLIGVRKSENRWTYESLQEDLARLRSHPEPPEQREV
jgi:hypothetical protein